MSINLNVPFSVIIEAAVWELSLLPQEAQKEIISNYIGDCISVQLRKSG